MIDEGKGGEWHSGSGSPGVVPLEGFHEGFGHTVVFRSFDRVKDGASSARGRSQSSCGRRRLSRRRTATAPDAECELSRTVALPERTIMSRTISPEMQAVVATQLIISRSWQSRAKADMDDLAVPAGDSRAVAVLSAIPSHCCHLTIVLAGAGVRCDARAEPHPPRLSR